MLAALNLNGQSLRRAGGRRGAGPASKAVCTLSKRWLWLMSNMMLLESLARPARIAAVAHRMRGCRGREFPAAKRNRIKRSLNKKGLQVTARNETRTTLGSDGDHGRDGLSFLPNDALHDGSLFILFLVSVVFISPFCDVVAVLPYILFAFCGVSLGALAWV